MAYLLFHKLMKHNPANSKWADRDRFVLSNGHASALLYGTLFLAGYDVTLEDLKSFQAVGVADAGPPGTRRYGWGGGDDRAAGSGDRDGRGHGHGGESTWPRCTTGPALRWWTTTRMQCWATAT
jgi:hypothetical protein